MPLVRLQRFLAQCGIASRRESERLILDGLVRVNGVLANELGFKVDPTVDEVWVQDQPIRTAKKHVYYLMHKPPRVLVTKKDPEGRKTVFDLIPGLDASVNAVGRLDYDSEGLLLLTNDGDLLYRLTHPSHEIAKIYEVRLNVCPSSKEIRLLETGIELDDRKTAPAEICLLRKKPEIWVSIKIHEGRNRQVRQMFEKIGCKVIRLIRTQVGPMTLGDLPVGKSRKLSIEEVRLLQNACAS